MRTRTIALLIATLGTLAGCSLDSITFLSGGPSDGGSDTAIDAPMIDGPSGPLGITVSTSTLNVPEGMTRGLMVSLTKAPPGALLVTLETSDDTRIGITPTAVLFSTTDWNTPQTVTVTGKQDADTSNETGTITLRSTGVSSPVVVNAMVTDDDGLSLMLSAASLDVSEGATASVAVHLSAQPATNVVITVASANTTVATTSQTMLTFTPANYSIDQSITVTGMQDADTVNNLTAIDFTSAALTATSLPIQITDDDVLGIATSSSSIDTREGTTDTFTVQLTQQPAGTTTVNVASALTTVGTVSPATLTFTTANYNVPQTVTVTAVADDDVADNATTITLMATGLATRSVALSITDDDTQSIIAAPATTLTVAEGGTSQLALSLAFRPSAAVTLAVSSLDPMAATVLPATVTFSTTNYATPQMVAVTGVQDADAAPDITTVRAESASLGLQKDVTINVSEDETLGIEASTSITVAEGGMTPLNVRLTAQPTVDTTVTVTSGNVNAATATPSSLTFTAANWNTYQVVTVRGIEDLDLVTSSTTVSLTASGLPTIVVPVTVTDNDTQAIVAATGTVNVTEGASTNVGITLAFIPTGNVDVTVTSMNGLVATVAPATLTFTPANYNVAQNITITGTQDADAANGTTMVSLTATGVTAAAIMVNVTDDDALNIDITPTTLTVAEGGNGTLQIRLTAAPAATTTVMVASNDTGAATVAPATLTFTTTNFATYQSVTVSGIEDLDSANETVTISASATGLTTKTATVTVTDNDVQAIVSSRSTISLGEAGSTTFNVHLAAAPAANTTVMVASLDTTAASVSPATLTFTTTNYATDQLVTVSGVADLDVGNETVTIALTASGIPTTNVTATVTDDDVQAIQVSSMTATVAEGGSTSINVTLAYQPGGSVTVDVASTFPGVASVTPATLTFAPGNYSTAQAISISGTEDADAANGTSTVSLMSAGATSASVAVTVTDNDTLGIELSPIALTVGEGSTATLQVRLTAQPPAGGATVMLASNNTPKATLSTGTVSFTTGNWNTFQNVTVTGVEDADSANDNATITATSSGLTTKTASVSITDNDVLGIAASPTNLLLGEGTNRSFNVHLTAMPPGGVTVTISNPDMGAVTVSPATLSFTQANYAVDQPVTVTGVNDPDSTDESVPLSLSAPGMSPVTVTANVTDDEIQGIIVSATGMLISEGGAQTLNVSLTVAPLSTATVSVSSTNPAVAGVSVSSLTFTSANYATPQPVNVMTVADSNFDYNLAQVKLDTPGAPQRLVDVLVREPGIIDAIDNPFPAMNGFLCHSPMRVRLLGNPLTGIGLSILGDGKVILTPTNLLFDSTNWFMYQNVDVFSRETPGISTVTVTGASPGLNPRTTNFTIPNNGTYCE